jgi:hypothetical protein
MTMQLPREFGQRFDVAGDGAHATHASQLVPPETWTAHTVFREMPYRGGA